MAVGGGPLGRSGDLVENSVHMDLSIRNLAFAGVFTVDGFGSFRAHVLSWIRWNLDSGLPCTYVYQVAFRVVVVGSIFFLQPR